MLLQVADGHVQKEHMKGSPLERNYVLQSFYESPVGCGRGPEHRVAQVRLRNSNQDMSLCVVCGYINDDDGAIKVIWPTVIGDADQKRRGSKTSNAQSWMPLRQPSLGSGSCFAWTVGAQSSKDRAIWPLITMAVVRHALKG